MRTTTIQVFWSPTDGQWYFRLRGKNGRIMSQSEGYPTRPHAARVAHAFQKAVMAAVIVVDKI